jgi:hypothetical protein
LRSVFALRGACHVPVSVAFSRMWTMPGPVLQSTCTQSSVHPVFGPQRVPSVPGPAICSPGLTAGLGQAFTPSASCPLRGLSSHRLHWVFVSVARHKHAPSLRLCVRKQAHRVFGQRTLHSSVLCGVRRSRSVSVPCARSIHARCGPCLKSTLTRSSVFTASARSP